MLLKNKKFKLIDYVYYTIRLIIMKIMNNSGVIYIYFDYTTNIKSECFQLNGKKEGIYREYYKNGKLYYEINYINNKKEGIYKKFYENR